MKDRAYAKINLALNVKGKRGDNYHDLEMIMVPIRFYDEIEMTIAEEMSFQCKQGFLRFDEKNTMVKMINFLKEKYAISQNFCVKISKHIPTRAGLAGGSADAASVLRLVEKLCHLSLNDQQRREAALAVGADVPFCLYQRPALVKGIGEDLSFFSLATSFFVLLVKPKRGISTKESFEKLSLETCDHPDVYCLQEALNRGDYFSSLPHMKNSLEQPSFLMAKEIQKIKNELLQRGCDQALMSGSGSTVFGISKDEKLLTEISLQMKKKGYFVRKTTIFDASSSVFSSRKCVK